MVASIGYGVFVMCIIACLVYISRSLETEEGASPKNTRAS
jgi:hypothetical protein